MDLGDEKTQLTLLAVGAVAIGGLAVVFGGNSTTTNASPGISGQAASTIAQENEASNALGVQQTLGLASIAGSLATTQANDRTSIVNTAQQGQSAIGLAQIASTTNIQDAYYGAQVSDTAAASDLQLGLRSLGVQQDISNNNATTAERYANASETNSWLNFGGSLFSGLTSAFTGGFSALNLGSLFGSKGGNYSYANNGAQPYSSSGQPGAYNYG